MNKATSDYKEWSKRVRADAAKHCSSIWERFKGGNYTRKKTNPNFNNPMTLKETMNE